nr:signal peptidase I [uncultured Anaerostipes sp.]
MITCIGGLLAVIIYSNFFTDTRRGIIPYRFYNVLTNSMEPKIGTDSLVLVKVYDKSMKIQKNDITTFTANRFGEKIIITHRFSHTERNKEGEVVYKTHPERTNTLDVYETKQEDILGVYLFHIPYAGKIILFFRSVFGLLWFCEMMIILLIRKLVLARWEEKNMGIL